MLQVVGENGDLKGKQEKINQKVKTSQRTMEQPHWGSQLQSKRGEEQESARDSSREKRKDGLKQLKQHVERCRMCKPLSCSHPQQGRCLAGEQKLRRVSVKVDCGSGVH